MKIRILCVGKLKERFYSDAAAEFIKRLSRFADVSMAEVADEKAPECASAADIERIKQTECRRLSDRLTDGEYVVALDRLGRRLSSEQFSQTLADAMLRGKSRMAFIIGGSNGLTDEIRARADIVVSFSDMTFSHQIFRIMLLEQIYRAFKIQNGEPYHK